MIHFQRESLLRTVALLGLLLAISVTGCGTKRETAARPEPGSKAAEKPRAEPPLAASMEKLNGYLFDEKGAIVAQVKAERGVAGRTGPSGGAASVLQGNEATLYEKGKPATTITADAISADQETGTVTGRGNVVARSLVHEDSPSVRADRMTWRPDENKIRGEGNVLMTKGTVVRIPGESFEADTQVRRITVRTGEQPVTGQF